MASGAEEATDAKPKSAAAATVLSRAGGCEQTIRLDRES
jgi:hypothetical protein